jgi:hypothetical protein
MQTERKSILTGAKIDALLHQKINYGGVFIAVAELLRQGVIP